MATTVWKGVSDCLFSNGDKVHYKRRGDLLSLEGKKNTQGIRFKTNEKLFCWNGLQIPVKIRGNDHFAHESLENPIKYCRIIRKPFKSGYKYFLQLVIGGNPPPKRHSEGSFKRPQALTEGNVGLDIGTTTLAVSSESKAILMVLAPESTLYEKELKRLKRKLDRSRRQNNKHNYRPDGTVIPGRKKWIKSNNYIKTQFEIKNLYRKKAAYIKATHHKTANHLLTLGDTFYVETMRFKALQKRSKETTINKNGRINSKKRFGKSISNHAPSKLISILDQKLSYHSKKVHKVNTNTFKASQYQHDTQTFIKKPLSQRHVIIYDKWIQRDLYSAFLLMNSSPNLKSTNQSSCEITYPEFMTFHDQCILDIKNGGKKTSANFGIKI